MKVISTIVVGVVAFVLLLVAQLLTPGVARAAGTWRIETPVVQENKKDKPKVDDNDEDFDPKGSWHVRIYIELAKKPGMNTIPMKLTFAREVDYQRNTYEPGKPPKDEPTRLQYPMTTLYPIDPGFSDVMGNIFNKTKFEFDLKRDAGYFIAGEYTVKLEGPDGPIGTTQKLTLKGINKKEYRGTMNFSAPVKGGADAGAPKQVAKTDDPGPTPTATDVTPVGTGAPMIPESAGQSTDEEKIKERPKGCGCAVPESNVATYGAPLASLAALALLAARRRKRK